jgi:hypothetical protein
MTLKYTQYHYKTITNIKPRTPISLSTQYTGVIRSVTGNILAEFTKEQGSFVSPRCVTPSYTIYFI